MTLGQNRTWGEPAVGHSSWGINSPATLAASRREAQSAAARRVMVARPFKVGIRRRAECTKLVWSDLELFLQLSHRRLKVQVGRPAGLSLRERSVHLVHLSPPARNFLRILHDPDGVVHFTILA